jgi:uncharacterized protein
MKIRSLRYQGNPHRTWERVIPLHEHPAFYIPPNSPVRDADGKLWSSDYPVIAYFWPSVFFQVTILLKANQTDYYCNVITPVTRTKTDIWFIDLDLDVLLMNGEVSLVDEEEFRMRSRFYPDAWIKGATRAKSFLLQMANDRSGFFAPAIADGWRDWLVSNGKCK